MWLVDSESSHAEMFTRRHPSRKHWLEFGGRELSNGGSRNKRTSSTGMKRTEAGLSMFSMFLQAGGGWAGGRGRATGGGHAGPRPRGWGCLLRSSCCGYHLVHVGIVHADAVNHVQQVLSVHCEDVSRGQHSPTNIKLVYFKTIQ